jgi:hypothetical protein
MTWKTSPQRSAASVAFSQITYDASVTLREVQEAVRLIQLPAQEAPRLSGFTMAMLRRLILQCRARRAALIDADSAPDLQPFIRVATSDATFDLAAERTALRAAYLTLITEGRALHNGLADNIAADGSVTESPAVIPAASATAFLAACANFQTIVEG